MPNINIEFNEEEFNRLKNARGSREWRDFILSFIKGNNRIGTYKEVLLEERINANQWEEIAKSLHYFVCQSILKKGVEYINVVVLDDSKVIGSHSLKGHERSIADSIIDTELLTVTTNMRFGVFAFQKNYSIVQDYLLENGSVHLDMPRSGLRKEPLKPDPDFHKEILGEKERTSEIVEGFGFNQ